MSPHTLLHTACKIFALYLFVLAALNLRDIILYWVSIAAQPPSDRSGLPIILLPFYMLIFNVVAGLFLLFKSDWITEWLKPRKWGLVNIKLEKTDIIELVIIAIGLLAILDSIPEMLYLLVSYAYFNDYERHERQLFWSDVNTGNMIFFVFKFIAGLFLLLNARNFSRRLRRIGNREDKRVL